LCGAPLAPTTIEGILEHIAMGGACSVRLTDKDGVSIDDTHERGDDGVIYEIGAALSDVAVVVLEAIAETDISIDALLGDPSDFTINITDDTPYMSAEAALARIFEAVKLPRLGGASGTRGWSSFSTFQKCPHLWKVRYLDSSEGLVSERPKSPALEIGTIIHAYLAITRARAIDPQYPLDAEAAHDQMLEMLVTPEHVHEGWRVVNAYWANYRDDLWEPLAIEHLLVDPKTGQSCRFDAVMWLPEALPGLPAGTYLWDDKCLQGDVKIWDYTTHKMWSIADLFKYGIAPKVQAYDVETGRLVQAQALIPEPEKVRDVYEVALTSGRRLQTSNNHPFLTARGWIHADKLTTDDWVAVPSTTQVGDFDSAVSDDEVTFLGYMLGEGCLGGGGGITWTQVPGPTLTRFTETAGRLLKTHGEVCPAPGFFADRAAATIRFSTDKDTWVRKFFGEHGLFGVRSQKKHVPAAFMSLPDLQTAMLLGALWDSDGSIEVTHKRELQPVICFTSSSPQLATDVQRLLLRLGIWSTSVCSRMTVNGSEYLYHRVTIITNTGRERFLSMVMDRRIPTARLAEAAAYAFSFLGDNEGDPIPVAWFANVLADRHPRLKGASSILAKFKNDSSVYVHCSTLIAWAAEAPELQRFLDAEVRWERVDTVLVVGCERLYNLSVPGPNTFVAQDIITHNSASRFDYATLNGWKNDGEIIGLQDLYERTKAHKRFGELQGIVVNILGKQKVPNFHRAYINPSRGLIKDHRKSLQIWSAAIETACATGIFPRARAACVGRYGYLCDEFDRCTQEQNDS